MTQTNSQIAQDFLNGLIREMNHDPGEFYSVINRLETNPELANVRPCIYYPRDPALRDSIFVKADYVGPQKLWEYENWAEAAKRFFDDLSVRTGLQFIETGIKVRLHDEHGMFEGSSVVKYSANAPVANGKPIEVLITQNYRCEYDKAEARERFPTRISLQ